MSVEATEAQAIDRTREEHVAALNSGDADAWAAAFSNDGVQMPPNAPANIGRDNIQAWSASFPRCFSRRVLTRSRRGSDRWCRLGV